MFRSKKNKKNWYLKQKTVIGWPFDEHTQRASRQFDDVLRLFVEHVGDVMAVNGDEDVAAVQDAICRAPHEHLDGENNMASLDYV